MRHFSLFALIAALLAISLVGSCQENPANHTDIEIPDEIAFYTGGVLYIMDLSTNSTRKVTGPAGGGLRWSPGGERIAYIASYGGWEGEQIYVVNANGTDKRVVTLWENQGQIEPHPDGGQGPVWSPDGDQIVFTRCVNCEWGGLNSEIFIIDLDTTEGVHETRLTNNPYSDGISDWSPDGQKILFQSDYALDSTYDAYGDWYTMNVDGSGKQRIMKYDATFGASNLRYSPDGQHIAFKGGNNNNEIYIMYADGSNINKITDNNISEMQLSWSPDGTRLVFTAGTPRFGGHIYTINIDGTGLKQITTGEAKYFSPEWRPERS